jgi:hypothetical protein
MTQEIVDIQNELVRIEQDHTDVHDAHDVRITSVQTDATYGRTRSDTAHTGITELDTAIRTYIDSEVSSARVDLAASIANVQSTLNASMVVVVDGQVAAILPDVTATVTASEAAIATYRDEITSLAADIDTVTGQVLDVTVPLLSAAQDQINIDLPDIQQQIDTFLTDFPHAAVQQGFDEVSVSIGNVSATLTNDYMTAASTTAAIAASQTALQASIDSVSSDLSTNYYTSVEIDSEISTAVSTAQTTLQSNIDGVSSDLTNNYYTNVEVDGEISSAASALETSLQTNIDALSSNLTSNYYTSIDTDVAIAAAQTTLQSNIDLNEASITELSITTAEGIADAAVSATADLRTVRTMVLTSLKTGISGGYAAQSSVGEAGNFDFDEGLTGWLSISGVDTTLTPLSQIEEGFITNGDDEDTIYRQIQNMELTALTLEGDLAITEMVEGI